MHRGKTIREEYPNGGSPTRAWELASGTKSFNGVIALCAVEDGLLTLEEKVTKTIPEWAKDDRKDATVRHVLTLTAGIDTQGQGIGPGRMPTYAKAVTIEPNAKPGVRFQYGPAPFMAFGEIMNRKLKSRNETTLEYLTRRVFKPLGIQPGFWRKDADGNAHLPSGGHLTARDWAKFGEMIRLDGKGVLKPGLTQELFKGTPANPSYGLTWWLPSQGGLEPNGRTRWAWDAKLPTDVYVAAGAGGQRLYVIPSRELVVVRQAPVALRDSYEDLPFLKALLTR
jgi:CubicO group peptidase (beta-lactamase class C family)